MHSEQSFIAAIKEHEGIIHKVCILYQQVPALREDLFQEIVLNAWKGFPAFKGEAKFSTWLCRVAINTAISFFRKSQKEIRPTELHSNLEPSNSFFQAEPQYIQLYEAIGELSKVDKALVMLYLDDYNYAEMADMIGISENYIAVKMARIRKKLKKLITSQQIID